MPTSSSGNLFNYQNLIKNRKEELENKRMSVAEPDLKNIDVKDLVDRSSRGIWGGKNKDYIEPKVVEDVINKRSNQIILDARDREVGESISRQADIKKQDINNYVNQANDSLTSYSTKLQNDINSGEISVKDAEKSLDNFQTRLNKNIGDYVDVKNEELAKIGTDLDKKWWDTRGKILSKQAREIITGTEGKGIKDYFSGYKTLKIYEKANIPNVAIATAGGFAVGAGVGAGLGILGATAGASTASSVGLGLGIGLGAVGVASGGSEVYSLSKQYSAGEISKGEFVATIGTGAIFTGASIGGAMAGGLAVKAITNYSTLNAEEKAISERLLNRRNSIEVDNIKGGITESQVKKLNISPSQKANLIKEIRVGNSVQKVKIKINKAGLTAEEIRVANKLNLRGSGYQVTSSTGEATFGSVSSKQSVLGLSSYKIKTGRGIARFNTQRTKEITSLFSGKSNKGDITGFSVSEVRTPPKNSLIRFGDKSSLVETRLEAVKGTGKVKYYREGGKIIRTEYSRGSSKLLRSDIYDSKGNWIRSDIKGPTGVSESLRTSQLFGEEGLLKGDLSTGKIDTTSTKMFKDIYGKSFSGKESPSFFEFDNAPIKNIKVRTPYPVDEGLLNIQKIAPPNVVPKVPTPQATIVSAGKSTLINLPAPAPSYVGGQGGLLSQSVYSGQGGLFGEANMQFVPAPTILGPSGNSMNILESQPGLVPKAKQLYAQEPIAIEHQLFAPGPKQTVAKQLYAQGPIAIEHQLFAPGPIAIEQQLPAQAPVMTSLNLLTPEVKPLTSGAPVGVPGAFGLFGLPGLGSPKTGGGQKGTKQKTRSSFLPEYNPSLGSVLTKQKAKQVTQKQFDLLSKKKYSGLFGRSRLEIVSKKKKPKKKK